MSSSEPKTLTTPKTPSAHDNSDLKFIETQKKDSQYIFEVAIKSPATTESLQISSETNEKKLGLKKPFDATSKNIP